MATRGHTPGLKPPGFTERLQALWEAERERTKAETRHPVSQVEWAMAHGIQPSTFCLHLRGATPTFEYLQRLADGFKVPWQWLVVGDEGCEALRTYRRRRAALERASSTSEDQGESESAEQVPAPPGALVLDFAELQQRRRRRAVGKTEITIGGD